MSEPPDLVPSPEDPAGAFRPDDAAAKALKKKEKSRKHWYNFAGRVAAQIVGAAASVALGMFVIQRSQQREAVPPAAPAAPVRSDSARSSDERAIAVLPLSNFSEDARQEYFADGMTEALTAELAQVEGLHVISRTSVMRYKTERKPVPVVAQELGVDFVVEGSVMRAENRVRVTAQLDRRPERRASVGAQLRRDDEGHPRSAGARRRRDRKRGEGRPDSSAVDGAPRRRSRGV